jgi:hypothetical protein
LILQNRTHALAIAAHASPSCRLFLFANPAFSLARLMAETAPSLAPRILVGTRLDESRFEFIWFHRICLSLIGRAKTQLFEKVSLDATLTAFRELGEDIEHLCVIGNHSHATFIDYSRALFLPSRKLVTNVVDATWLSTEVRYQLIDIFFVIPNYQFQSLVRRRGGLIRQLAQCTSSSALSAAVAIAQDLNRWYDFHSLICLVVLFVIFVRIPFLLSENRNSIIVTARLSPCADGPIAASGGVWFGPGCPHPQCTLIENTYFGYIY